MRLLTVTALGALVLAATAAPAHAQGAQGLLRLTITPITGRPTSVLLTCEPDGGSHPRPAEACAALRTAFGDLNRLPDQGRVCTLQYDPVTAKAVGVWHGHGVIFRKRYGNACILHSALDPVFQFGT